MQNEELLTGSSLKHSRFLIAPQHLVRFMSNNGPRDYYWKTDRSYDQPSDGHYFSWQSKLQTINEQCCGDTHSWKLDRVFREMVTVGFGINKKKWGTRFGQGLRMLPILRLIEASYKSVARTLVDLRWNQHCHQFLENRRNGSEKLSV